MKISLGSNALSSFNTIKDIKGFNFCKRYIILSEIHSNTIPDIMDMVFNILPGCSFINNETEKTKVMVINVSNVTGDVHGNKLNRTRNVYMHHGFINEKISKIDRDSVVYFTDLDWNIISDKDTGVNKSVNDLTKIMTSYDYTFTNSILVRDTQTYVDILTPPPIYYEEKDMILLSHGNEMNYIDEISNNKESVYYGEQTPNYYECTMYDLIDQNTSVLKLNVDIEYTNVKIKDYSLDELIGDIVTELKYLAESNGYSRMNVIMAGENGFNIDELRTYLFLDELEQKISYHIILEELSNLNTVISNDIYGISLFISIDYCNIKVRVIKTDEILNTINNDLKTDKCVNLVSDRIKDEGYGISYV